MSLLMIVFFAIIFLVYSSVKIIKGEEDTDSKMFWGSFVIVLAYFALYIYPNAEPLGVYPVNTEVKYYDDTYSVIVDIEVGYGGEYFDYDDFYSKTYIPRTIHWPNGGYTALDQENPSYTKKHGKYLSVHSADEEDRYEILIPQIQYLPTDKLLSLGWMGVVFIGSIGVGVFTIVYALIKNKK